MNNEGKIIELKSICEFNIELYKQDRDKYVPIFMIDNNLSYHLRLELLLRQSKNYLLVAGEFDTASVAYHYQELIINSIKPILLIDISIFGNGFNLINKLLPIDKNLKFIILFNENKYENLIKAKKLGALGIITKSKFSIAKLDEIIDKEGFIYG